MDGLSFLRKDKSRDTTWISQLCTKTLKTLPTSVGLPAGKVEVTEMMELQESSINDLCQMRTLYDLRDHYFGVRVESFYWDLEFCVEWKPHVIVCEDQYDDEYGDSEERDGPGTFVIEGGSGAV